MNDMDDVAAKYGYERVSTMAAIQPGLCAFEAFLAMFAANDMACTMSFRSMRRGESKVRRVAAVGDFLHLPGPRRRQFIEVERRCGISQIPVDSFILNGPGLLGVPVHKIKITDYLKPNAISRYRQGEKSVSPSNEWRSQLIAFSRALKHTIPSIYKNADELLMDPHQPFAAWFRVLMAKNDVHGARKCYGTLAYEQLMKNTPLLEFLRTLDVKHVDLTRVGLRDYAGIQQDLSKGSPDARAAGSCPEPGGGAVASS